MTHEQKANATPDIEDKNRHTVAGARFSEDKKHRYALWRIWDTDKPLIMLIGLNPSTANETTNDPTIRRLSGSRDKPGLVGNNGYGGFYMMNLFAYVTAYPEHLKTDLQPISVNNDWLEGINILCDTVCFCWGNFNFTERAHDVIKMFPGAMCFGKNANGSPKHPLYLKGDTKLIAYNQ